MNDNKTYSFLIIKLLFFLLPLVITDSFNKVNAQKKNHVSIGIHSRDTIIIDYLLHQGQFYDLPLSDTSNPRRFAITKGNFHSYILAKTHKKEKDISIYGFGSNYSHSRSYLLIVINDDPYKILGGSSLEDDLSSLYNFFGNLGNAMKAKGKIACYEFLIRNYAMNYPPPMHLIKDTSYERSQK